MILRSSPEFPSLLFLSHCWLVGRVTQISGVGWKAQLPFKDFRGSLCPCQPVSELPPACFDKGIKWERERGWGAAQGEEQLVCRGWAEFLNDLIPVSAARLTVGIPVSPRDNGNSLLLISPPQSHLSTSPSSFLSHLFPIFYCVPLRARGTASRKSIWIWWQGCILRGAATLCELCQAWPCYPSVTM